MDCPIAPVMFPTILISVNIVPDVIVLTINFLVDNRPTLLLVFADTDSRSIDIKQHIFIWVLLFCMTGQLSMLVRIDSLINTITCK